MSKLITTPKTVKVADKAKSILTPSVELKKIELDTKKTLTDITKRKDKVRTEQAAIKKSVKVAIRLVTTQIKLLKNEHFIYEGLGKRKLAKLVKDRLNSKEPVINTVCNTFIMGLNFGDDITLSSRIFVISSINNKSMTKNKVNGCNEVELMELIKTTKVLNARVKAELLLKKKK